LVFNVSAWFAAVTNHPDALPPEQDHLVMPLTCSAVHDRYDELTLGKIFFDGRAMLPR
jgi:hypothetical protein